MLGGVLSRMFVLQLNIPYPWHPRIMDTQVALVGQLAILPVPGEFTTMCGRRLREKVLTRMWEFGVLVKLIRRCARINRDS